MRRRTRGQQYLEVVREGRTQPGLPRLGSLFQDVDGLTRPILARRGQPRRGGGPELGHRSLLADDHSRTPVVRELGEGAAPLS